MPWCAARSQRNGITAAAAQPHALLANRYPALLGVGSGSAGQVAFTFPG